MQDKLNIYPNTPPHDFSLKTRDIEGARNKFIERRELMERLKAGDQNIMFSQGATNKLNQDRYLSNDVQQLRQDYNTLKAQVDQLNSTIKQSPDQRQQQRGQNNSPYQQLSGNNYNPNRYSGNSDQKINIYRNVGSQIMNTPTYNFPRNQSQGNIQNSPSYEKQRLGSQGVLSRITSPQNENNIIRSEKNLFVNRVPTNNNNMNQLTIDHNNHSPMKQKQQREQYMNPSYQQRSNFLQDGFNDSQMRGSQIFQMNSFLNRYERHRYVPPQKNEFSRFPSKQVFFY